MMASIGQGAQVMLWRAIAVKATAKVLRYLPNEPQSYMHVRTNFDSGLLERGFDLLLRFDKLLEPNILRNALEHSGPRPDTDATVFPWHVVVRCQAHPRVGRDP